MSVNKKSYISNLKIIFSKEFVRNVRSVIMQKKIRLKIAQVFNRFR